MKMTNQQLLEELLDGELSAEQQRELRARLAAEPQLARTLELLESERTLRLAAINSFAPTSSEASARADAILAACEASTHTVGRITPLTRWLSGVAAILLISTGSFLIGRITTSHSASSTSTPMSTEVASNIHTSNGDIVRVIYNDEAGEAQVKEFASMDDANSFLKDAATHHPEPVAVASGLDIERPGSF